MMVEAVARAAHVLAVVVWIGGVAMVTMVILPSLRQVDAERRAFYFETIERRFSWIARAMIFVVGVSGLVLLWKLDLWAAFRSALYWWLDAMVAVWLIFVLLLFVAEPLFLHRRMMKRLSENSPGTIRAMLRLHWLLLTLSLLTIAGAVAGAHGFFAGL